MDVRGKKIFVGLSGGVDSSVTAALLVRAGAQVTGVFIQGWYPPGMPCTWAQDRRDAMRVAAHLHIPFHTLDASQEYKQGVIDYLLSEYRAGRTPNPDVMCNREVKFGAFFRFAKQQGADYIATGHYARQKDGALLRGVDAAKDQSYFLWAVPSDAIAHTLFPLGEFEKSETRARARTYGLPVSEKKDSQGICFLGSISVEEFLARELGTEPGEARDEKGVLIGAHSGALLHTLGERVALANAPAGPWYVVRKDLAENILIVSHESRHEATESVIKLRESNWLAPLEDKEYSAQYRYHGPLVHGHVSGNSFIPSDSLPETLAPGQSLVIYDEDRLIGGGIML